MLTESKRKIRRHVYVKPKRVEGALNHPTVRNYSNEGTRRDSHMKRGESSSTVKELEAVSAGPPVLFNTALYLGRFSYLSQK